MCGYPRGHRCVKQPCSVQMYRDGMSPGHPVNCLHLLQGDNGTPGAVMGIFQADQGSGRKMNIIFPDHISNLCGGGGPSFALYSSKLHPG